MAEDNNAARKIDFSKIVQAGVFGFHLYSLTSSALDHSATAPREKYTSSSLPLGNQRPLLS